MEAKLNKKTHGGSIKNTIVGNYLFLFIISIFIFEIFLMYSVRYYYYSTVEGILRSQAKYSAELYLSYLSDNTLEQSILEDRDQYYRQNVSQVQILDNAGRVLLDNLGTTSVGKIIDTDDVNMARGGKEGRSVHVPSYDDYNVMSYSSPLYNRTEQVGIIRLITSLRQIDNIILKRNYIFIIFGVVLTGAMIIVSFIIANSIVKPINELTQVASKLAEGKFNERADESSDDEIGKLASTMNFITDNINKKEQLKNDFISSISHELRTPLTSIKGWAVTLQDEVEEDSLTREGLIIIEKESDRLKSMVEELLDFSRFTAGRIDLNKEIVNLTSLVKSINKQLMPRAKNSGINMILNYDHENTKAVVDKNRIRQVLINLLDNSLKFTENEGVVITNLFEKDDVVIIEVIDTGIGIDSEEIALITGKFYKGRDSNSHTGLGLSICEEIVKLHDGKMIIESKIGEGTKIAVSLPKGIDDEKII
ncbi:sensor histidine kinase [Microaceticoccus formicicus]|uniref:sensor histidine kinase n=1 Tax=Microaceticoccus formicicus TaxID=3118105 RepID=UPI003CCFF73A|nr:HAMP domain-containing sensor histidine kinase [Peptoniphilaceae bacterium AMB_02]